MYGHRASENSIERFYGTNNVLEVLELVSLFPCWLVLELTDLADRGRLAGHMSSSEC